jgi:predicted GIY-YIG superfamily endonuclease
MGAHVYILRCRDGAYYVGSTRTSLERRVAEHNSGTYSGWTCSRRPVVLVFSQYFEKITDAIAAERQIKGWSRAKKAALTAGNLAALPVLARSRSMPPHPSTGSG